MQSKETALLELFFNQSKYWHFEELRTTIKIGKPQLARWLKMFKKEGLIKRIKEKSRMPYYAQDFENPKFRSRKKLFAWQKLFDSGLLSHLNSLEKAKAIILFGSFSRSDWSKDSDIDIFIYGNDSQFQQGKYELKLNREIQVHHAQNTKDLKKMEKMLPYLLSGIFIKGGVQDLGVKISAKA
jgi:predicted nucleotidyltransferase